MLKPFGWFRKMMVQVAFAMYTTHTIAVQFGSSHTHTWRVVACKSAHAHTSTYTRRSVCIHVNAMINGVRASSVNYLKLFGWTIFDNCRRWKVLECWSYHTYVRMVAQTRTHLCASGHSLCMICRCPNVCGKASKCGNGSDDDDDDDGGVA